MERQTKAKAEQYTDIMLEHMPVGVALYDVHDFRLLMANPLYHKFLDSNLAPAWKGGRAIGHPLMDWVPGEVASYFISIFRRVAETGEQYRAGEYVLQSHACGITYWNWTLDPIRDSEGHVNLLLLIANEVTTQVLARQEAEEAHASLSQVNRTVEVERKRLEVIETIARNVRESIEIETVGKAAIDAINFHFNSIDVYIHIADPVQQALRLLHLILEGLELTDTLMGYYDEARITQVLSNLINNAIKYSPSGGEIEVGLRYTPGAPADALIWVKDQGIGIPASELPHIFNRFHRASGPHSPINGLGIGLYLVNEQVNSHGGHVWVESTEGAGSTFFVTLPLHANQQ